MKNIKRIVILAFLVIWSSCAQILAAQDSPPGARSISSDDFVAKRPAGKARGSKTKRTRVIYKYIRVVQPPSVASYPGTTAKPEPPNAGRPVITQIGVTLWRLRPPNPGEDGVLFAVGPEDQPRKKWVAGRVRLDTIFRMGDRIRFGIESSEPGFLYLFSREIRSDGSLGAVYKLFPESDLDDNYVTPGTLFDFPDRADSSSYRYFDAKESGYVGDIVTVVVARRALTGFVADMKGRLFNPEQLEAIESGSKFETFQRYDNDDRLLSKSEAEASCGATMRGLEKEKPGTKNGCGKTVRGLSKEGPYPQSIFEVKAAAGQPWAASFRLDVQR